MPKNIKVAIVDDHKLFREGLAWIVNGLKAIRVVVKASNGEDFLKQLARVEPDVVLMDLQMPEMDGIETTTNIRKRYPNIKIIGLSILNEKKFIIEMIKAGAHGYLLKNCDPDQLENAIRVVCTNDFYFNDNMTEALCQGWHNKRKVHPDPGDGVVVSERERQILQCICEQQTSDQIGRKLKLSIRTVENYRYQLIEKAGVKNTAGLVMYAIVNDLVRMDLSMKA